MAGKSQHIKDIDKYVNDVIAGRRLANKWEIAACKRYKNDLKRSRTKKFPYKFDHQKAERAIKFIETLPHTKGRWASLVGRDRLIKLEGWQKFIVGNTFGWVHKKTGLRRFRVADIYVPRKNGKSVIAAGIGLYMLAADGEFGAEVYCGATTEKQAWEVFKPAKLMAERTPVFRRHFGIEVNARFLEKPRDGSVFAPIIGKPGDGASPSCSIVDEFHEHDDDDLYDTMITGMGARDQPLMLVITTAGSNIAGPCYQKQRDLEKVLEGVYENDQLFGVIYTIDKDDDWKSEGALIKANPNYGVSVGKEFLKNQIRDALQSPRKINTVKRKHFNIWVGAKDAWMNMELWNGQADASLKREDFVGDICNKGLDLSSKLDITANVDMFTREIDGKDHYYIFGKYYLPEDVINQEGKEHYQGWVNDGYLTTTDGNVIDYSQIEEDIVADANEFQIEQLGYDAWGATDLAQRLQDAHGISVVEVPQTAKHLSEPMKWIEAMVLAGRLHHDGNPVLTWMISNVVAREDANENLLPRKDGKDNKIDGAVATIMSMLLSMKEETEEETHTSIYETMSF